MDKNQKRILTKWSKLYLRELKKNLKADGNKATGSTERSLKNMVYSQGVLIQGNESVLAISEGKEATAKKPSDEMVRRIDKWIMKKNPRLRDPKGKFAKRKGSTFNKRLKIAYGVAMKINRTAWKGSKAIDRAYNATEQMLGDELTKDMKNKINKALEQFKGNK
jgi:hypothetical protein